MNSFGIFRLLKRNDRLSFYRSPAFEQSMVAKVMMFIGGLFMLIYLIVFGIMFSVIANESGSFSLLLVILPLLLLIDFGLRFMIQQTPLMLMKPYMLLPIPRRAVIDTFLITSIFSGWNWLWLGLMVPYFIITLAGGAGFLTAFCVLAISMILIMIQSQWYLMVRTLISRSLLWWLLPAVVYPLTLSPLLFSEYWKPLENVTDYIADEGGSWWMLLLSMVVLAVLYQVNRLMQYAFVYEELSKEEKTPKAMKHVSNFSYLNRFGLTGEYLKLEMKSIFRNTAVRSRVLMSLVLVVVLSLLITFTDMYDGVLMLNFWCYYCYSIYGMTALVKVMGPEGNYIDLLMVHRENTLQLLKAKYYFHCAILLVPFLIMLPATISGKFSWMMMLAYALLSSGLLYFLLFMLAIFNKQTLPLNQKITGKGNMENGLQLLLEMVAMFLPIVLVSVLLLITDETQAYVILALIGLLFTVTHSLWLKLFYQLMMKRKYENLEGFHSSR